MGSDVNARVKCAVANDHTYMDVRQYFKRRPVVSEKMSSRNKTVNIWLRRFGVDVSVHISKKTPLQEIKTLYA